MTDARIKLRCAFVYIYTDCNWIRCVSTWMRFSVHVATAVNHDVKTAGPVSLGDDRLTYIISSNQWTQGQMWIWLTDMLFHVARSFRPIPSRRGKTCKKSCSQNRLFYAKRHALSCMGERNAPPCIVHCAAHCQTLNLAARLPVFGQICTRYSALNLHDPSVRASSRQTKWRCSWSDRFLWALTWNYAKVIIVSSQISIVSPWWFSRKK